MQQYKDFDLYSYAEVLELATEKTDKGFMFLGKEFVLEKGSADPIYEVPGIGLLAKDRYLFVSPGNLMAGAGETRPKVGTHWFSVKPNPDIEEKVVRSRVDDYSQYVSRTIGAPIIHFNKWAAIQNPSDRRRAAYNPPKDLIIGLVILSEICENTGNMLFQCILSPSFVAGCRGIGDRLFNSEGYIRPMPILSHLGEDIYHISALSLCIEPPHPDKGVPQA